MAKPGSLKKKNWEKGRDVLGRPKTICKANKKKEDVKSPSDRNPPKKMA